MQMFQNAIERSARDIVVYDQIHYNIVMHEFHTYRSPERVKRNIGKT